MLNWLKQKIRRILKKIIFATREEFRALEAEHKRKIESVETELASFRSKRDSAANRPGSYFVKISNHTGERVMHTNWRQKPSHK